MSDNDYTVDALEYYMHTGEFSELFEEDEPEEYVEESQTILDEEPKDLNKQLDDVIRLLKKQIKEKERIIKMQKKTELSAKRKDLPNKSKKDLRTKK